MFEIMVQFVIPVWITLCLLLALTKAKKEAWHLFSAPFKAVAIAVGFLIVWAFWKPVVWLLAVAFGITWEILRWLWRFLWTPWAKPRAARGAAATGPTPTTTPAATPPPVTH